jgi:hypothetical protein
MASNFRPGTLDVDNTVLGGRIQRVSLTAPNQFINIGNTKVLQLTSNSTTASDRPFSFTKGSYLGQELTIQCVGPGDNKVQLQTIAAAYIKISEVWSGEIYSQLKLTWNGVDWIEAGRSSGGSGPGYATVPVGFDEMDTEVIQKRTVTLSPEEVQNSHTVSPILIPGIPGKIIIFLGGTWKKGAGAYAGGGDKDPGLYPRIVYRGTPTVQGDTIWATFSENYFRPAGLVTNTSTTNGQGYRFNQDRGGVDIILNNPGLPFTGGVPITVDMFYRLVDPAT